MQRQPLNSQAAVHEHTIWIATSVTEYSVRSTYPRHSSLGCVLWFSRPSQPLLLPQIRPGSTTEYLLRTYGYGACTCKSNGSCSNFYLHGHMKPCAALCRVSPMVLTAEWTRKRKKAKPSRHASDEKIFVQQPTLLTRKHCNSAAKVELGGPKTRKAAETRRETRVVTSNYFTLLCTVRFGWCRIGSRRAIWYIVSTR